MMNLARHLRLALLCLTCVLGLWTGTTCCAQSQSPNGNSGRQSVQSIIECLATGEGKYLADDLRKDLFDAVAQEPANMKDLIEGLKDDRPVRLEFSIPFPVSDYKVNDIVALVLCEYVGWKHYMNENPAESYKTWKTLIDEKPIRRRSEWVLCMLEIAEVDPDVDYSLFGFRAFRLLCPVQSSISCLDGRHPGGSKAMCASMERVVEEKRGQV
jgi:hypothetical protein